LPDLNQLEQFVEAAGTHYLNQRSAFTLLLIDVVGLEQINLAQVKPPETRCYDTSRTTRQLGFVSLTFSFGTEATSSLHS
jgi:hypothetical protein